MRAKVAIALVALTASTVAGTALTIGLYSAMRGPPDDPRWTCVLVAAGHLVLVGAYAVLGESLIEDGVKSGVFMACGGLLLTRYPLLGLAAISAAAAALVVNQGLKRGRLQ